jgi:hypothetical protein
MSTRQVLCCLLGLTLVISMLDARQLETGIQSPGWNIVETLVFSFLCFFWYRLDSDSRLFRRTALLNIAVVMMAPLAVPYYLLRSRAAGARGRALVRFAGFVLLLIAVSAAGAVLYALFS